MTRAKELTKELCRYVTMFNRYWDFTNNKSLGSWCYTHPTYPGLMYWCLCTYTQAKTGYTSYTYISEVIPGTPRYKFQANIRVFIEPPFMDMYLY